MRADHRKPVVAFVLLACAAAVLIGMQRAEAQSGRFFTSFLGLTARVEGALPGTGRFVRGPYAAAPAQDAWFSIALSDGGPSSAARPVAAGSGAAARHRGRPPSKDAAGAGRAGAARDTGMEPAAGATVRGGRRLEVFLGRTSPGRAGYPSARRAWHGVGRVGRESLHRRQDRPRAQGLSRPLRRARAESAHDAARLPPAD